VDASLRLLNHLLQPKSQAVHLAAKAIPLELQITGQEVPQLLIRVGNCLLVLLLGFLEHLLGLLNLHLAGLHVNIQQDSVLGPSSLQGTLQCLGQLCNSLSKLSAPCIQPLLLDDSKDCNDVCKVFLSVNMGIDWAC
jgi:hypothetical protein